MSETKKPLPVDQTESGEGGQLYFDEVLPDPQSTTVKPAVQAISALLLRGEANAVSLGQLAAMTGLDQRVIRRLIQRERQAGACICVNNRDGYYLAETVFERDACARSMLSRARAVERTAQAIASAEVLDG